MQTKYLTLGVFAHANAGKTTITENILYKSGIIQEIGKVDNGTTITDNLDMERERGITIRSTLVTFPLKDITINLIDTPGHIDFSSEVERAINVLDGAVLVISGVEGIESQTYTIWKYLSVRKIPTIIFINKMDRSGADYKRTLEDIKFKLKAPIYPLEYVDNNLSYSKPTNEEIIEYLCDVKSNKLDGIITEYLDNKTLDKTKLENTISELAKSANVVPVLGGSGLKSIGIDNLMTSIYKYLKPYNSLNQELSFYVYTVRFEKQEKRTYIKVLSDSISLRDTITIEDKDYKVTALYKADKITLIPTKTLTSGEMGVIVGLDVYAGQYVGTDSNYQKVQFVTPLIDMEVIPLNKEDTIRLTKCLVILNIEDPYLNLRYAKTDGRIFISLMGEVQKQVIENTLKTRFQINAILQNPLVIHKETPCNEGIGECYYTSISGVKLAVKPLEKGSGFIFKSKLSTDYLLKKYQRQTERLIEYYHTQGLFGWEVTDCEVSLIDGHFDSMASKPKHFNICVPLAFIRALRNAGMKILEPICSFEIIVPDIYLSNVLDCLSLKNSNILVSESKMNTVTIQGEAPMELVLNFPIELNKLTKGLGIYTKNISKYRLSRNQKILRPYTHEDARNEVTFVINDMQAGLDFLDPIKTKRKKESRSKYKRIQKEKEIRINTKNA